MLQYFLFYLYIDLPSLRLYHEFPLGNGFSSDTITSAGSRIQEQVRRFLKSEEDAMTERIRKYTEEQKRLYTAVQSRAYNDKRSFLR